MERDSASVMAEIKKYEDTLAKEPASYCFAPLAELYRKTGNLDDAVATAKRGCELHPDYVGGIMALGRAYFENGMKAESRAALERVINITPDNLLALKLLSLLYQEQGDTAAACKALRSILAQNPDDHESQALLDSLTSDEVDLEELEIIEDLTDEDLIDEDDFSVSLGQSEPPEDGADAAAEAKNPISTSTLAELYVSQGFLSHAVKIYQEMLNADPDNADLRKRVDELSRAAAEEAAEETAEGVNGMPEGEPAGEKDIVASAVVDRVPFEAEMPAAVSEDRVIETLERWLDTIRRRR
ncbi:MAG TPA: tetratricopeptide repeat protein [Geobacteraceae bacterium]|nr:tetratricopeptide repeat protein [Geobacteraceae bacterium]